MVKACGKGRTDVLLVETLDLRCVPPVAVTVYSFQLYTFKGLMNYTSGIIHHVRIDGFVGGVPVLLKKPQTYMNLSGESCGPLAAYYKLPLNPVIVLHDLTWILWEWMVIGGSLVLCLDTAQWVQDGITMYDCASCKSQK